MIDLYKNIKSRRLDLQMTQSDLAAKVGYADKGMISRVENGKIDLSQSQIEKFADALETTPAKLMGWSETSYREVTDPERKLRQAYTMNDRILAYVALLAEPHYQELLDAANGCNEDQLKVAINVLEAFKAQGTIPSLKHPEDK